MLRGAGGEHGKPANTRNTAILRLLSVGSGLPETDQPTTNSTQSHPSRSSYQPIPSQHPPPPPHIPAPRSHSSAAPPWRRKSRIAPLSRTIARTAACHEVRRASRPRTATAGSPRHPTPPTSPEHAMWGMVCLSATACLLTCTIVTYPTLPT